MATKRLIVLVSLLALAFVSIAAGVVFAAGAGVSSVLGYLNLSEVVFGPPERPVAEGAYTALGFLGTILFSALAWAFLFGVPMRVWFRLKNKKLADGRRTTFRLWQAPAIILIGILGMRLFVRGNLDHFKKVALVKSQLESIEFVIDKFQADQQRFPRSLDELLVSFTNEQGQTFRYIDRLPTDPWTGSPLTYEIKAGKITVISYGADGAEGGEGINADLILTVDMGPPEDDRDK